MDLTRSRKHRLIAGVCGGIAERLGWSPFLVRILYIIIPFAGIPLYIILWILIPDAKPEEHGTRES
jgi:phage shock protein PspC (stress-responsive transcriptional regulator)